MKRNERGSSLIEATVLGVVILAPLIWALTMLAGVHEASLAATAAVREAGAEAARSSNEADARAAIDRAVVQAFSDQGIDPSNARINLRGAEGFVRGGIVEIEVQYPVSVLRAPFFGVADGPSVWVKARHIAQIDPFGSRP